MEGWKIYNHCWIPTDRGAGGGDVDVLAPLKNSLIWREGGLFAQWTTDFDCAQETGWWHVIRSKSFSLDEIKSDYRKKIKRGEKNFRVEIIKGEEYVDTLYFVAQAAVRAYRNSQSSISRDGIRQMLGDNTRLVFAAFENSTGKCCGFAVVVREDKCINFLSLKVDPTYERLRINEAMTYARLLYFNEEVEKGGYIDAGARCVSHNTRHQDFLQEKFLFRKAYCKLHFVINPRFRFWAVVLFQFRWVIRFLKKSLRCAFFQKIDGVMTMMEVSEERKYGWCLPKRDDK